MDWLFGISIAIYIVCFTLFIMWLIYDKAHEEEWSYSRTMNYFFKLRCIFPKTTKLIHHTKETNKKKENAKK